jgi:hypothetical protein
MATFRQQVVELLKCNDETNDPETYPYKSAGDVVSDLLELVELYTPTVTAVRIVVVPDDDPDLSYLGDYTMNAGDVDTEKYTVIDRDLANGARFHQPGSMRFFVSSFNYVDDTPEDREKYARQDFERMEAYFRNEWWTVGVYVEADVTMPGDGPRTLKSGGIWGNESDSGEGYIRETAGDEIVDLRTALVTLGVEDFSKLEDVETIQIVERFS